MKGVKKGWFGVSSKRDKLGDDQRCRGEGIGKEKCDGKE